MGLCYNTLRGHDLCNNIHTLEASFLAVCGHVLNLMYYRALIQVGAAANDVMLQDNHFVCEYYCKGHDPRKGL